MVLWLPLSQPKIHFKKEEDNFFFASKMTAVFRVKRKNTDSPLDKLVIACKRAKTESPLLEESEPADVPTDWMVIRFAGTLADPTEDVVQHVAKVRNADTVTVGAKRTYDSDSSNSANVPNKKWIGANPTVERYKVVSCQRSQDTLNEGESDDKWLTLVDVEDSWSISGTAKQHRVSLDTAEETEDIEDYAYDVYYGATHGGNDDVWFQKNEILIQEPVCVYLPNEDARTEESSDDSNSESNWRNDYPDTDPDSRDEDCDSDCSNNDDYLNADPREEEDKRIYGRSYAEYRRIIQAQLNDSSSSDASDDEERSSNDSSDGSMGIM